jgi:hypothetical protein
MVLKKIWAGQVTSFFSSGIRSKSTNKTSLYLSVKIFVSLLYTYSITKEKKKPCAIDKKSSGITEGKRYRCYHQPPVVKRDTLYLLFDHDYRTLYEYDTLRESCLIYFVKHGVRDNEFRKKNLSRHGTDFCFNNYLK